MKEIKNKEYYICFLKKNLERYKSNVENIPNIQIPKVKLISITAQSINRFHSLVAQFSMGESLEVLKESFTKVLHLMDEVWNPKVVKMHMGREQREIDVYYLEYTMQMRWMLALAILLEVPDNEFNVLVNLVKRDHIQDALYDICIKSRHDHWVISNEVNPQKPKNKIVDIIFEQDKKTCEKMLKTYLEKQWYKTLKNVGVYNSHLLADERYSFYGIWAFEVAALVKIKGLDDSTFRDNVYYPDRLV